MHPLDGFDEIAEVRRQRISEWISKQMQEYDRSVFIITSRPAAYKSDFVAQPPQIPLFVRKFSPYQQRCFVKSWYLCQESTFRNRKQLQQARDAARIKSESLLSQLQDSSRPELKEMAENPLLLNMLATFHRFDPGTELPKRRVELYKNICEVQLDDRPRARGISILLPVEKSLSILQRLALTMVINNCPTISRELLLNFLQKQSELQVQGIEPAAFLEQIVQISELLIEREKNEFEFPHLSFQGYFAATCLEQMGHRGLNRIQENWNKSWWRETILLYTPQLTPSQLKCLITKVCDMEKDNARPNKEAAQLAYDCLREYRNPEKLDTALNQELRKLTGHVQTLRYQQLEEYLKSQQWKQADSETYRLMITTVGKEVGESFSLNELLKFPCEELLIIDSLWMKYSQGRFAFTKQKTIYEECGAKLNGNYPGDEIWNRYSDRVGWRKDGKWIDYEDLNPSLSSPMGHFPWFIFNILEQSRGRETTGFWWKATVLFSRILGRSKRKETTGFWWKVTVLFSRIETCNVNYSPIQI